MQQLPTPSITRNHQSHAPLSELDRITELAGDLAGQFELVPLLERVLGHAVALLGCESGSISIVHEAEGYYRKEVDQGVGCHQGQTFPLTEGLTGQIVATRGTVILDCYASVPAGHIDPDDPRWRSAVIGVPIAWDGAIIGTFAIFSNGPGRVFTAEDASLVELFANHAAIAIMNSRLHQAAAAKEREAAVAGERERAVQEVHETIGRSLSSLLLHLDRADKATPGGSPSIAHIDSARVLAHEALFEARRTVLGLAPSSLAGSTIEEAVRQELDIVSAGYPITITLLVTGEQHDLAPVVAHQLFMVIQEALANVVAHSRATTCRIGIFYEEAVLTVIVEDNGRGFERPNIQGDIGSTQGRRLGLHGIAARAHYLRGEVHVDSTPGWGTSIRVQVPYSSNGDASRERWKVLVACTQPLIRAGLVRLLETSEPSVQVLGEVTTLEDLTESVSLLQPDMIVLDDLLLGEYAGARSIGSDTVERPVVVVIDHPTNEQLTLSASSGVRGFISLSSTPTEVARVVVAAARGDALLDGAIFSRLAEGRGTSEPAANTSRLTARELEVRTLLAEGLADKQIATRLGISVKTVEKHVGAMLRKTGARNRTMLVTGAVGQASVGSRTR
ncbi:GAF domain-containing protein [Arthrobacter sp. zg-Y826]|uniref:hybrid sensor histidine kinase/response regulator transcription factor n=1 Tax=Arthrobacter jinronghuae TaxID=2964609 RepID=UPI0021049B5C|nr:GAF domain-containing protein [Arthrobacter jinronghuae]MCQ1958102.1 GAF domain-containing protein [Arthrobacter jinronghuae]